MPKHLIFCSEEFTQKAAHMTTYALTHQHEQSHWPVVAGGMAASLVGIGLARFAYTPLLPSMIDAKWFEASAVAFLGAANLAGYLLGALGGRALSRQFSPAMVMRFMMLLAAVSFMACAFPISKTWFFAWRLLSGIAGGAIMVVVSSIVLPQVPHAKKGIASGAIFLGIGVGIIVSGTLVPLMLRVSLQATWLAMGLTALALTLGAWGVWPKTATQVAADGVAEPLPAAADKAMRTLLAQYALMAFGLVPEMMFFVDYVARSLDKGAMIAAHIWVAYGVGAAIGPLLYGMAAHHFGARSTIRATLAVQFAAVVALIASSSTFAVFMLAAVIGSFPSGAVPAALARVHELVQDHHVRQRMWGRATVSFALMQAVSGYVYSGLYQKTHGNHVLLFGLGAVAYVIALLVDFPKKAQQPAV